VNPPTVGQALREGLLLGLDRMDAEGLLLHALGRPRSDRAWLRAHDTDPLTVETHRTYAGGCQRRLQGEPLAYITGTREFHGLELQVDARVLDPRADTETLVDWALELLGTPLLPDQDQRPRVADLGTGSGAVALALRHRHPRAQVWAVDASAAALEVARANAQRLGLEVHFAQGDWLTPLHGRWSLLVSNPPYIADADPHLAALGHEPLNALVSGADGLDDIRRIVSAAPAHLCPGGWLLLEHGHDQGHAVARLLEQRGFTQVQHRKDLAGIVRCTGGCWQSRTKER
jgi:release factor glutamine methyltransferase